MRKSRPSYKSIIPTRREFLGLVTAFGAGTAVSVAAPDISLVEKADSVNFTTLRDRIIHEMGDLNIEPDTFENLIAHLERFDQVFEAAMAAQGTALAHNVFAGDYMQECLRDKQFQILLVPTIGNFFIANSLYDWGFDYESREDWADELSDEFNITYLQARHAISVLSNHIYTKSYTVPALATVFGAMLGIAERKIFPKQNNDIDSNGPWDQSP